jgi:hypothetical protein
MFFLMPAAFTFTTGAMVPFYLDAGGNANPGRARILCVDSIFCVFFG